MAEFTEDQRKKLAENEQAMPDGSYPIRNRQDLKNAIQAYGRSKNKHKTKAWIKKRARELKAEDLLPDEWTEEIWHYGIKGMKWGIRRYQNEDGSLTTQGKKRYDSDPANDIEGSAAKKKFTLTDQQKKWVKRGAIAAGLVLAAYGGYKLSQTDFGKDIVRNIGKKIDAQVYAKKVDKYKKLEFDEAVGLLKKSRSYTPEEDLKIINQGLFQKKKGASFNCTFCTTAYELRRRGYDVQANFTEQGRASQHVKNFFKNAVIQSDDDIMFKLDSVRLPGLSRDQRRMWKRSKYVDMVSNELAKNGNGARGNLFGYYAQGGGHSIIWEVVDGKTVFRDGQSGRTYSSAQEALRFFVPGRTEFFRTDNLEINKNAIKEAVSNIGTLRKDSNIMEYDSNTALVLRRQVLNYMKQTNCSMAEARRAVRSATGYKV